MNEKQKIKLFCSDCSNEVELDSENTILYACDECGECGFHIKELVNIDEFDDNEIIEMLDFIYDNIKDYTFICSTADIYICNKLDLKCDVEGFIIASDLIYKLVPDFGNYIYKIGIMLDGDFDIDVAYTTKNYINLEDSYPELYNHIMEQFSLDNDETHSNKDSIRRGIVRYYKDKYLNKDKND